MDDKVSYSVEVRESLRGGDDYSENHYDFDTPEEIQNFLDNDLYEDERVHSILKYRGGEMIKDITNQFKRKR